MTQEGYPDYVDPRPIAVITGACGGMGKPIARLLGHHYQLAITDVGKEAVDAFAAELANEGYAVPVAMTADLGDRAQVAALAAAAKRAGALGALVHTAALWGAMADWRRVTQVNLVGTAFLLDAFLPQATTISVAVLIASGAGYFQAPDPALYDVIDRPLEPGFFDKLEPFIQARNGPGSEPSGTAYGVSKLAMIRMPQQRVGEWARQGARIVSLSPGAIYTRSAVNEEADKPRVAEIHRTVPLGRWGRPMDIARVVEFLCSDGAAFVTGCDIRVDGGLIPHILGAR